MKAKDIESCENCPLSDTKYCAGGMIGGPGGTPIEPPCCSWSPEDEIKKEDYDSRTIVQEIAQEEYYDRIYEEEKLLEEKKKIKNKRAKEARLYIRKETKEIKKLRKKISANQNLMSFANALVITNDMMRIKDHRPSTAKSKLEQENEELQNKITQIKKIKKEKLKEMRRTRYKDNV